MHLDQNERSLTITSFIIQKPFYYIFPLQFCLSAIFSPGTTFQNTFLVLLGIYVSKYGGQLSFTGCNIRSILVAVFRNVLCWCFRLCLLDLNTVMEVKCKYLTRRRQCFYGILGDLAISRPCLEAQ